jgi:hypothetical protein
MIGDSDGSEGSERPLSCLVASSVRYDLGGM